MSAEKPIVTYDFVDTFPFWMWVSSWGADQSYPKGFRYKILSSRSNHGDGELVLVLEERGGAKTEMKRLAGDLSAVLRTARSLVKGLAESYELEFDALDFSDVTTYAEFERKAASFGWPGRQIP